MSLMDILGGSSGNNAILMQAIGAAMRGENAQEFMTRLAEQHPQLKQMNLADLPGAAQQLCQQKGVDPNDVVKKIDGIIDPMFKK